MEYYHVTEKDFELTEDERFAEGMNDFFEWEQENNRSTALESLFNKRQFDCYFTDLKWPVLCFYWLKTFICLCINRQGYDSDDLEVLVFNESSGGESGVEYWTTCSVGRGIFTRWYINNQRDST